jgi:DNA-directed RNA polymerase specialized sigma24 family protein
VTIRFAIVNRGDALDSLPEAYAAALRMRDVGTDLDEIARRLRIAPEAVTSALELADAKLARLLALQDGHTPRPGRADTGALTAP